MSELGEGSPMKVGINCAPWFLSDADSTELASELAAYGFHCARFPAWLSDESGDYEHWTQRFTEALAAVGMESLVTLDSRAFTVDEWQDGDYAERLRYHRNALPLATRVQVGNEPDQVGESSSTMTLERYRLLWVWAQRVFSEHPDRCVPAGMVHVDFTYYSVAGELHPYAQTPSTLPALIAAVVEHSGRVPIATEFGWEGPGGDAWSLERADWYRDMLEVMAQLGVQEAFPYCYSAAQCPDLYLVGTDGEETASLQAVQRFIREKASTSAGGGETMPEPNADIQALIDEVGTAGHQVGTIYRVSAEGESGDRRQAVYTDVGIFRSVEGVPGAYLHVDWRHLAEFIPKA